MGVTLKCDSAKCGKLTSVSVNSNAPVPDKPALLQQPYPIGSHRDALRGSPAPTNPHLASADAAALASPRVFDTGARERRRRPQLVSRHRITGR